MRHADPSALRGLWAFVCAGWISGSRQGGRVTRPRSQDTPLPFHMHIRSARAATSDSVCYSFTLGCNSSSCRATIAARTCLMAATCASGPSSAAYGARTAATLASPSASRSAASPVPGASPTVPPRPPLAARAVALALAVTAPPPLATAEAVATIACTSAASTLVGGGASISSLWSEIGRSACTSKSNGPSCATPKVAGIRTRWVPAAGLAPSSRRPRARR